MEEGGEVDVGVLVSSTRHLTAVQVGEVCATNPKALERTSEDRVIHNGILAQGGRQHVDPYAGRQWPWCR